jgi:hypothetical protein
MSPSRDTLIYLAILDVFGYVSIDIRPVVLPLYQLKRTRTPEMAREGIIMVDTEKLLSQVVRCRDINAILKA